MRPADWKTAALLRARDSLLEDLTRMRRNGVDATPLPACVLLIERELARRELESPIGRLQVQAEVRELTP